MFTGIVRGRGAVKGVHALPGLSRLEVELPPGADQDLEQGASIAVDGVCLTVTEIMGRRVKFDAMQETLRLTTLGDLASGSEVNIERAAKDGAEVGGHAISGHVDCTATIIAIEKPDNNWVVTFEVPPAWRKYIFQKGYVALNGTSLTISGVDRAAGTFQVWFIPETLRLTTFGLKRVGDRVNLEVERGTLVTVDTIRDFLQEQFGGLLPAIEKLLASQGQSLDQLSEAHSLTALGRSPKSK